jgi:glucans biosynthesis protein
MLRRTLLKSAALLAAAPLGSALRLRAAEAPAPIAQPKTFDFAWLKGQARARAASDYRSPPRIPPGALTQLNYERYQGLRFRPELALWAQHDLAFRVQFFHLGHAFSEPVQIYDLVDGQPRRIAYDPEMFDFRRSGINPKDLPDELDFAGFRVHFHTDWRADIAAFLGASYFRAVGGEKQYGLSARGLAIDTGLKRTEEFPIFETFWLERPERGSTRLTVYALMDSPSIAGAYRFEIEPGPTLTMDVDAAVYPRRPIELLGIAPLSSMFLCGENDRRMAHDWRPEIHDSDGLAIWTGNGERLWRPLVNPAEIRVNSYVDDNPRGFGLLQRDREFDHYQDDGAWYDRRPSLWIEPKRVGGQGWGKGAVQLIEIPTPDETHDNIVVLWAPADKPQPKQELLLAYRLYWGARMPFEPALGSVVATRNGIGGKVGQKRKVFSWRFAIDFAGGELAMLGKKAKLEAVVSASRGAIGIVSAEPQAEITGYRAKFDLRPTDDSLEPINLRLTLRLGTQVLTESWIYQWTPPSAAERRRWMTLA